VNPRSKEKASSGDEHFEVAVVGGGPAGLRAAEVAAQRGAKVAVFDAKPSVGRKFLVAGRGGLNLTHAEDGIVFRGRYRSSGESAAAQGEESRLRWEGLLGAFGPAALREWAAGLGVETFTASTGRVYPREMKAAPLLRRWVARLRSLGVEFRMRHRLKDLHAGDSLRLEFEKGAHPGEGGMDADAPEAHGGSLRDATQGAAGCASSVSARALVLALGGASWPQTGSDGGWLGLLQRKGALVAPLRPANCGWERDWPPEVLAACEGKPLKNILATAGGVTVRGELLVTRYGLEGGALYSLSQALHEMAEPVVTLDFKPDSTLESLLRRLGTARSAFLSEARLRWRLDEPTHSLLSTLLPAESFRSAESTALLVKQFQLTLTQARPVAEAISTAGGVAFPCLNEHLMLRHLPGVFIAGEMLDWEAPTGGYLMQGCFATGTQAGQGAVDWLSGGR
jgi:uncharacterized flavoprotein (TIGR03862 family)